MSSDGDNNGGGLRVLSYNIWAMFRFVCEDREERMKLLADRLDRYDVVCLQEQWYESHFHVLFGDQTANHKALPYRKRFKAAHPIGSGLTLASRYPIVASTFIPFKALGPIERVHEGDYHATKGIAVARIQVPKTKLYAGYVSPSSGGAGSFAQGANRSSFSTAFNMNANEETEEVIVINTHLIGSYTDPRVIGYENETLAPYRVSQMHQLAEVVSTAVGRCSNTPVILCGDLNSNPGSPELSLLRNYCMIRGLELQSAIDAPTMRKDNTYLPSDFHDDQLDYVLFTKRLWQVNHAAVCFDDKVIARAKDRKMAPLSDHYAVEAVLQRVDEPVPATPVKPQGMNADAARAKLAPIQRFMDVKSALMRKHMRLGYVAFVAFLVLGFLIPSTYVMPAAWGSGWIGRLISVCCGFLSVVGLAIARTRGTEAVAMEVAAEDLKRI